MIVIDHAVCVPLSSIERFYGLYLRRNDRAKATIPVPIGINGLTGAPVKGNAALIVVLVAAATFISDDGATLTTVELDDTGVVLVVVGATVVDVVLGTDVDVVTGDTVVDGATVVDEVGHVDELLLGHVVELAAHTFGHVGHVVGHGGQVVGHVGHVVETAFLHLQLSVLSLSTCSRIVN